MPDMIATQRAIRRIIEETMADCRVSAELPPDRKPTPRPRGSKDERLNDARDRDDTSGWSVFIDYTDSQGFESSRRITLIRCEARIGGMPAVAAYCHEAGEYRLFRRDRISSMALCGTGEVVDRDAHLALLRETGLPFVNRGMLTLSTILLFVARCDGHHHPAEWTAIEDNLTRYALRFDGSEQDIAATMDKARSLAPDATDFANALIAIARTPVEWRRRVVEDLFVMTAGILDADSHIPLAELQWGDAVSRALRIMLD